MKHLINIVTTVILISIIILSTKNTQAQSVTFEYDAAGNMVQRSLTCVENPPEAPIVKNIGTTYATIKWEGFMDITGFEFKKEGGAWQTINRTQSSALLVDLQSCQKYILRLLYTCSGETEYAPEISFTTTGCTNCSANGTNIYAIPKEKSMTVNWDIYPNATYIIHLRKAGESTFAPYETPFPTVFLPVLEACTTYEFALKIKCTNGTISPWGKVFSFSTTGCRLAAGEETALVQVHPNPANQLLTVEIESEQSIQQLEIYNSSGQLVKQLKPQAGIKVYSVEVNDFASGVYLIKAHFGDEVVTQKFSVQ